VTLVLPPRSESLVQGLGVVYKEIAQRDIRV
jgi:hypothetical protein